MSQPNEQPAEQPATYLDHINAAQSGLTELAEHANQHQTAAIAQAHALTAIALLLEELLGTIGSDQVAETYQTIRIIGGLPNQTAH